MKRSRAISCSTTHESMVVQFLRAMWIRVSMSWQTQLTPSATPKAVLGHRRLSPFHSCSSPFHFCSMPSRTAATTPASPAAGGTVEAEAEAEAEAEVPLKVVALANLLPSTLFSW